MQWSPTFSSLRSHPKSKCKPRYLVYTRRVRMSAKLIKKIISVCSGRFGLTARAPLNPKMHDFEPNLPEQTDISSTSHHTGTQFARLNQLYGLVFSLKQNSCVKYKCLVCLGSCARSQRRLALRCQAKV